MVQAHFERSWILRFSLEPWQKRRDQRISEQDEKYREWQSWWAWHPIRIDNDILIFEKIYRKRRGRDYDWQYKHLLDFLKEETFGH
jgi:hypothetical protein